MGAASFVLIWGCTCIVSGHPFCLIMCMHRQMDFQKFFEIYRPRLQDKIRIDTHTGCHIWTGAVSGTRYGVIKVRLPWQQKSNTFYVHRLTYILFSGNLYICSQIDISHLCHNSIISTPKL